jgi:protein-S-isoprenylcysteine O-methyltransferase Ste14
MSSGRSDDARSKAERMEAIKGAKGPWWYATFFAGILTAITVVALVEAARRDESRFVGIAVLFAFPAVFLWLVIWRTAGDVWKK